MSRVPWGAAGAPCHWGVLRGYEHTPSELSCSRGQETSLHPPTPVTLLLRAVPGGMSSPVSGLPHLARSILLLPEKVFRLSDGSWQ